MLTLLLRIAGWLLLLILGACGPTLQTLPSDKAVNLSGQWQMQPGLHEPLVSALRQQLQRVDEQTLARERHRERSRRDEDLPPPPEMHAALENWQARDRQKRLDGLLLLMVPSESVTITQHALDSVDIQSAENGMRRLDTHQGSRVMHMVADLEVRSGWQGRRFCVYSHDGEQNLSIIECYERQGEQLKVQVQLSLPHLKDYVLDATYQARP